MVKKKLNFLIEKYIINWFIIPIINYGIFLWTILTRNKNAYIKISPEGKVLFYLPQRLQWDQELWQILVQKAEKLRKKHQARPKIEKRNEQGVLLFGEFVEWEEITPKGKPKSEKMLLNMFKSLLKKSESRLKRLLLRNRKRNEDLVPMIKT